MLLHDLTGRARGKCVAFGRQIRARDCLGDRGEFARNLQVFQSADDVALRGHRHQGRRSGHPVDREHVADAIHHGDDGRLALRLRFGRGLGNDLLHVADRKECLRIRAGSGAAGVGRPGGWRRRARGTPGVAAPAARRQRQRRGQRQRTELCSRHRSSSPSAAIVRRLHTGGPVFCSDMITQARPAQEYHAAAGFRCGVGPTDGPSSASRTGDSRGTRCRSSPPCLSRRPRRGRRGSWIFRG